MTTYLADKMQAGVQPKVLPAGYGVKALAQISMTTSLLLNDIIQMLAIEADPANAANNGPVVLGAKLDCDALDSGSTLTLDLGDSGSAQRYLAASTIGQAGGSVSSAKAGVTGYAPFSASYGTYTTVSYSTYVFQIKCHAAPTTWANGSLRVLVDYTYDP